MRDILVIALVALFALMALRRPWIGVMLWTWISIMNPHRYAWGFAASAPVAMVAALVTLIGMLFSRERESPFKGAPVWLFFAFSLWITLSWLLGVDPVGDYAQWDKVMKIYLMTFVALILLNNRHHIMAFVWVTAGSLALLGLKGGIFTVLHAGNYRVWGPGGSFIQDNNAFALALIVTVPLVYFLYLQVQQKWARYGLLFTMSMCVVSALGSHSRGALLALIAMGAVFWWRSRHKGLISALIALMVLLILPMMPAEWWARMGTIAEYQQDHSAIGRLNGWIVAWEVAKHHFFGAGMSYQHQHFFDLYGYYNNHVIAAHSIYFQVLGNHGFGGLVLYLAMWLATYRTASWLRVHAQALPQAQWAADLGAMVQVGLVGFAVGGAFLSLSYFDLPYNMMVMVVLARRWVQTRGWERDPPGSLLEYAGLMRRKRPHAGVAPATGMARRLPS
ncbi:putative O-glycosylation ligase, exosortase A system-associated [Pseudothauera hydrothermalis]|jgi:probable O-glycosylation ligase (exosortase A-associated)|uniref:putative O-glycosylation ligase, exosortase A system-associated n=1 Tax=Pseudothauera hydrothermalis TaxID=2184083 RepID=UPI000C7B8EEB|nr:putative O-glycosylation ligase, exosortase A system-associated [Pseudothauera hydrothermalis]AUM00693.1 putative O-glycosylation ligase, exosortase A system-associated [Rhodocyclaceae bacterium]